MADSRQSQKLFTFGLFSKQRHERVLNDDDLADVVGLEKLRQNVGDLRQELFVLAAEEGEVLKQKGQRY